MNVVIGPVMDTCKELPFEELNTIQVSALSFADPPPKSLVPQNSHLVHGKNYYMKAVYSSGPQADLADKLMSRLPQLRAECGANITVAYEFLPMKKILSIPNDATAQIRGSHINVLVISDWENKDTDILDKVRKATSELCQILRQGEKIIPESLNVGYGNYSKHGIMMV